ncbi:hypothetical protein [Pelomonas sp. KK5]|uniref:hypothetical protein n=1 Tax=Pelomonas sp. KK5 TaxID=1855730 RepID=UPI00097BEC1B|nr:hypothetical protein [Pelomonas sp. KK5]
MSLIELPPSLGKSYWDSKKKGTLPAGSEVEKALQALERKHGAVDWKLFDARWAEAAKSADELDKALAERSARWRSAVLPLKAEAAAAAAAAQKIAKGAAKPLLDAIRLIGDDAKDFGKAIDKFPDELQAAADKARRTLGKGGEESGSEEEDEGGLADPKRLLQMLQRCKRDPALQVHYAFSPGEGKAVEPALVMSPRVAGKALFARLAKETGVKLGAFGLASIDGTVLRLSVDKPYSGLAKKVRVPVKACGFRISQVLIVGPDGASLESDAEEEQEGGEQEQQQATGDHAMAAWTAAREQAIAALKEVAKEIAAARDPEAAKAVMQIQAVMKNLSAEPREPARLKELVQYLDQDDVVLDVSEFATDIRTPLLKALAGLQAG